LDIYEERAVESIGHGEYRKQHEICDLCMGEFDLREDEERR
jgi:hypothetical protein